MEEYKIWQNLYELRGSVQGHLPLTQDIIDFFKRVSEKVKPKNILEFGTNLGGSAALQLTLNPEAKLTSFDPSIWHVNSAIYAQDSFINTHPKTFDSLPVTGLLHIVFGIERFRFVNRSSCWVKELTNEKFDYAFIDGSHAYEDAFEDIKNCIDLEIPYLVIDNIVTEEDASANRLDVKKAVDQFANQLEEIDFVEYETIHPLDKKVIHDKCILFKVIKA